MSPRIGLNREIITNIALEIAERDGMNAVTMTALANELAIKPSSLYNHFKGFTEVKQEMAVSALNLQYQQLKEVSKGKKAGPETIISIGNAYIEFANHHPEIYEASLSAPDPFDKEIQSVQEAIVNLSKEALSVYSLNEKDMVHAVRGLRSFLHGLVDLKRKGGFNLQIELEESQEKIMNIFLKGLSDINSMKNIKHS